jgi:hypothetical protein
MADDSLFFIDGMLHLRAELTIKQPSAWCSSRLMCLCSVPVFVVGISAENVMCCRYPLVSSMRLILLLIDSLVMTS